MQKQLYLSIILGLLINTMFFAQTQPDVDVDVEIENVADGQTEVIIERIVIDEDGNETKVVIKKTGADINEFLSNENIAKLVDRQVVIKCDELHVSDDRKVMKFMDIHMTNDHEMETELKSDEDVHLIIKKAIEEAKASGETDVDVIVDLEKHLASALHVADGDHESVRIFRGKDGRHKHAVHKITNFIKHGKSAPRVRMGVHLEDVDNGILVKSVTEGSSAAEAGLAEGDIITSLDKQSISSHKELMEALMQKDVGDKLKVGYLRGDKAHKAKLILKENPNHHQFASKTPCTHIDKPCLGVTYNSWNQGIRITNVYDQSGAENSGLQPQDKLISINGKKQTFGRQFDILIKSQKPGDKIEVVYERDGEQHTTEAEIGVWDDCGVCNLQARNDVYGEITSSTAATELKLESFDMYPIPARDEVTVSFIADNVPTEVTLYDVNGKIIDQESIPNFDGSFTKSYQLNDVTPGMALITITQDGKSITKKALIQ